MYCEAVGVANKVGSCDIASGWGFTPKLAFLWTIISTLSTNKLSLSHLLSVDEVALVADTAACWSLSADAVGAAEASSFFSVSDERRRRCFLAFSSEWKRATFSGE